MGSRKKRKSIEAREYARRRNERRKEQRKRELEQNRSGVSSKSSSRPSAGSQVNKAKENRAKNTGGQGAEAHPSEPPVSNSSVGDGGGERFDGQGFREFLGDTSHHDVLDQRASAYAAGTDVIFASLVKRAQAGEKLSRHEMRYVQMCHFQARAEILRRDEIELKKNSTAARLAQREREIELRSQKARELPGEVQEAIGESNGVDGELNASGGESGTFKGKKNTVGPSNYKKLPAEERAALMDWLKDLSKREGGAK